MPAAALLPGAADALGEHLHEGYLLPYTVDAADILDSITSLTEDDVEAAMKEFNALRKGATARRCAQT